MVYCIFTYSEDEQLVQLCVQRLREADRAAEPWGNGQTNRNPG